MQALRVGILAMITLAACAPAPPGSSVGAPSTPQAQAPTPLPGPSPTIASADPIKLLPEEAVPFSAREWATNFKKHIVPFSEILSGGPPKDGIPAIDEPKFIWTREASEWLKDNEPVFLFQHKGDTRAYPLQILIWQEIVNDTVGGLPAAVTFLPALQYKHCH